MRCDFGALHTRFVHGFVTDTRLDGDSRRITFASRAVQREPLIDCDDAAGRLVGAGSEERLADREGVDDHVRPDIGRQLRAGRDR
jgi:hypothetical protein